VLVHFFKVQHNFSSSKLQSFVCGSANSVVQQHKLPRKGAYVGLLRLVLIQLQVMNPLSNYEETIRFPS